jgi:hypothetical protein
MTQQSDNAPERLGVMSPFTQASQPTPPGPPRNTTPFRWVLVGVSVGIIAVTLVVIGAVLWKRTVQNPYRTLETFPVEKYFESPQALLGNRFRATVRVEGELGWSLGVGKLMVFSVESDPRFIPVIVKGDNLSYAFSKGQTYLAQIEVKERGLIYATDLRKN